MKCIHRGRNRHWYFNKSGSQNPRRVTDFSTILQLKKTYKHSHTEINTHKKSPTLMYSLFSLSFNIQKNTKFHWFSMCVKNVSYTRYSVAVNKRNVWWNICFETNKTCVPIKTKVMLKQVLPMSGGYDSQFSVNSNSEGIHIFIKLQWMT